MFKKTVLIIGVLSLLFSSFVIPVFAANPTSEGIWFSYPEPPDSDFVSYFAIANTANYNSSNSNAYMFYIVAPLSDTSSTHFSITIELLSDGQEITITGDPGLPIIVMVYTNNKVKVNSYQWTIPQIGVITYKWTFASSYRYFWFKGNLAVYDPAIPNIYAPANILFRDDVALASQMSSLLLSINTYFNSLKDTINTDFAHLETTLNPLLTLINNSIVAFQSANHQDLSFIKTQLDAVINQTIIIDHDINAIYALLQQYFEEETVSINDEMSDFNEMASARDDLVVTDQNGNNIDAVQQVDVAFSEAASGIGSLGDGVSSVNTLITDIFGVHPLIIVPVVVALALGLVVTILGKNKSD